MDEIVNAEILGTGARLGIPLKLDLCYWTGICTGILDVKAET